MVDIAKPPRPWFRIWLIVIVAIGLCAFGLYRGRNAIRQWRAERVAKEARVFLDKKDVQSAILASQRGLSIDPESAATWSVLADTAEAIGRSEAVFARARAAESANYTFDSVVECAQTALQFGEPQAADFVLSKLSEDRRNDARYYALCGRTAAALGRTTVAVQQYAAALVIEPKNEQRQLDSAAALLARGWLEDRVSARATLERLKTRPELHVGALRALLKDSMAVGESTEFLTLARKLAADPGAALSDKLVLAGLLSRPSSGDEATAFLDALQKSARGKPAEIAELAVWLNATGQFRRALDWANDFSAEEWADARVCGSTAVNLLAAADWSTLESFTDHGNWGNLEYFRLSLHSRALREQGNVLDAHMQWIAAVKASAPVPHAPAELVRLASVWQWEVEVDELLRALSTDAREGAWASAALYPRLAAKKDTVGLWQVAGRIFELDPQNNAAANNFAMFSFLLGRDVTRAFDIAQKLHVKHPGEAKYVSTYAYSLHLRGQTDEAVRVMSSLDPTVADAPDIAMYFGIFLAAAGDTERATKYLDLAQGAKMLREEEELVRRARARIAEPATAKQEQSPAP